MKTQKSQLQDIPFSIRYITEKKIKSLSPQKVISFGSYVYGDVTFNRNVDLLIILDTKLKGAERQRAVSRLIHLRPSPVDIIVRTPAEIEASQKRVDPFLNEMLEKGFVLYA